MQLFVGAVTTAVLIYVAYLQFRTSEREVALEYAKVSPQFLVRAEMFGSEEDPNARRFPSTLEIRMARGEATLTDVNIAQDIRVTILVEDEKGRNVHNACTVRIRNYFTGNPSLTEWRANPIMHPIFPDPSFFFPDWFGNFAILESQNTWVKIGYKDVFGDTRSVVFSGSGKGFNEVPGGKLAGDPLYEVAETTFRSRPKSFPQIWDRRTKLKTPGCRYIVDHLQRS